MHAARRLWATLEPLHALVYFGPEVRAAGKSIGLRGYWDTYFAFRAAPLGSVAAPGVVAMFAGFEPDMVARSLPSAWSRASVEDCLGARSAVAADALRAAGVSEVVCATAVSLLSPLDLVPSGRPLGAANAALPLSDDPVEALWQLATTVREYRGDGHVAALTAAGLSGVDAVHLQLDVKGLDSETMRQARGWSPDEWAAARSSLSARGLVGEGGPSAEGAALLADVEEKTDLVAWQGGLSSVPVDEVVEVLAPAVSAVWSTGQLPEPNPVGVPRTA